MTPPTSDHTLALVSRRVVTPDGIIPAAFVIKRGRIESIISPDAVPAGVETRDYGDLVLMPGVMDTHVHINDPGTDWEGFPSATDAAAAGGITTLVDMPLNSLPVTTTAAALHEKRAAAKGRCRVQVGFFGGLVHGNAPEIPALLDAGVLGIKAFLIDSGLPEFTPAGEADLRAAMPLLAARGVPLLAHAELVSDAPVPAAPRSYAEYLASRPRLWELRAIELLLNLCAEYQCPVHIVHLANADALPLLAKARASGLPVTVETCPHYLYFASEDIPDGATQFKCAPPIRERINQERLWDGLRDGIIDSIASDHSPCPPGLKQLKTGDFGRAWGGIASLQWMLPIVWTAAQARGFTPADIARWLCAAPARLVGLDSKKGALAPGLDADIVVWNPEATFTADPNNLCHRHPVTPYAGETLHGVVHDVYLRGTRIFMDNAFPGPPAGREPQSALMRLNALPPADALSEFTRCCGASVWAQGMTRHRLFRTSAHILETAETLWPTLAEADWLEAFAHHPKIGDMDSLRAKFADTRAWASGEQGGAADASGDTLRALAEGNAAYEAKFGYIFIVCATGKTAAEMLALLQARLPNDPADELPLAADEQKKITRLRLQKLLTG